MVKNATELTPQEFINFVNLFRKSYKESLVCCKKHHKIITNILTVLDSKHMVSTEIEGIMTGKTISYVSVGEDENILGFIVGEDGKNETGIVTHLYIDLKTPLTRRLMALDLYKMLILCFKFRGMKSLEAISSIDDVDFMEILASLGFKETKNDAKKIDFRKIIS